MYEIHLRVYNFKGKVDGWVWCSENREGKLLLALVGWVGFF